MLKVDKIKTKRIIILSLYVFLACIFVFLLKPVYFYSILIILAPPGIINFIWAKGSRKKILIFSTISTLLLAPPLELAARLTNLWDVQSIFPRPFDLIPLENMLASFLNIFWVLSFYEYFVDKKPVRKSFSPRFKYLVGLFIILSALIYSLYFFKKELITISYFEMAIPVLIIPSLLIFFKNPKILKKLILPTIFFWLSFLCLRDSGLTNRQLVVAGSIYL